MNNKRRGIWVNRIISPVFAVQITEENLDYIINRYAIHEFRNISDKSVIVRRNNNSTNNGVIGRVGDWIVETSNDFLILNEVEFKLFYEMAI